MGCLERIDSGALFIKIIYKPIIKTNLTGFRKSDRVVRNTMKRKLSLLILIALMAMSFKAWGANGEVTITNPAADNLCMTGTVKIEGTFIMTDDSVPDSKGQSVPPGAPYNVCPGWALNLTPIEDDYPQPNIRANLYYELDNSGPIKVACVCTGLGFDHLGVLQPFSITLSNLQPGSHSVRVFLEDRYGGYCAAGFEVHASGGIFAEDAVSFVVSQTGDCCDLKITKFPDTPITTAIDPTTGGSVNITGSITSSKPVNWALTVAGRTFSGSGSSVLATWDGKDSNGKVVEPGTYPATLTAKTTDGQCSDSKTIQITVTRNPKTCMLEVTVGSTANVASGNLHHSQSLFTIPNSKLLNDFTLSYNSLDPYNGVLGTGWTHTYNVTLRPNSDGTYTVMQGDGTRVVLSKNGNYYTPQTSPYPALSINPDGTYRLYYKSGLSYIFSPEGKLTDIEDRNGNTTTLNYDANGSLTKITDLSARVIQLSYDADGRITTITDPMGNTHSFTYASNTLTGVSTQSPDNLTRSWSYTYDANAFMLTKTDPMGYTTTYTYDSSHRVLTSTDPEGKTKAITYPSASTDTTKTTTVTETDGGIWTYKYDTNLGVLTENTDPEGGTTKYTYDSNRNLLTETDPKGNTTTYTYDGYGNITSVTDPQGNLTTYTYNEYSQVTGITDPQGNTTKYTYNSKGNLTSITEPTGATTQYQYDTKGNIISITNPDNHTTTLTYDQYNNLTSITDPTGATTSFTYDASGNMTSQTDAQGNTTGFQYNSLNQLIKVTDPMGNVTQYTYDANGNRTSQTDANGNVTRYEYNYKGQLLKVTDALGNVTTYTYRGTGCTTCGGGGDKLTSITNANGNVTTYQYDQLGRLTKETDPLGNTITYSYDSKGNLTSKTDANGNTVYYSYDALRHLTKKTYPDGTTVTFTYNPKGNILTAANHKEKGSGLEIYIYIMKVEADTKYTYSYDSIYRLLQSTPTKLQGKDQDKKPETFTYDPVGNRQTGPETKDTYSYNSGNQLTNDSRHQYQYDRNGNLIKKTETDDDGKTTTWTYSYDYENRLTQVVKQEEAETETISFGYDPFGRRVWKQVTETSSPLEGDGQVYLLKNSPDKIPCYLT